MFLIPWERRLRRVSKDEGPFSLMVGDGARAPPHHEDIKLPWLTPGHAPDGPDLDEKTDRYYPLGIPWSFEPAGLQPR
jgi:hypothetical protein